MMLLLYRLYKRLRQRRSSAPATQAPAPARAKAPAAGRTARALGLVSHQARFELLGFVRNRQARFFTVALPVIFLVVFVGVFGNDTVGPEHVKASIYYVPGLSALAVIAASFVNLVISVTAQRELGILKRRRATPVPAWVLIAGRTLASVVVGLAVMTVLLAIGRFAYGVHLPGSTIPGILLPGLCPLHRDPLRRFRPADAAGGHAAAVLHLRRVHPQRRPPRLAAAGGQGLPRPAPRRRPPPRLGPRRLRQRHRLERPRHPGPVGRRRPDCGPAPLHLDTRSRSRLTRPQRRGARMRPAARAATRPGQIGQR